MKKVTQFFGVVAGSISLLIAASAMADGGFGGGHGGGHSGGGDGWHGGDHGGGSGGYHGGGYSGGYHGGYGWYGGWGGYPAVTFGFGWPYYYYDYPSTYYYVPAPVGYSAPPEVIYTSPTVNYSSQPANSIVQPTAAAPATSAQYQPAQPNTPTMTVADVKALAKGGLGDEVILSQMRSRRAIFHLTTEEILDLNSSQVSQKVIDFMINTANSPRN